ncbi:MAG: hypothetical protein J6W09_01990 [Bacteroidales bacterium]|nr:hypothetical protein [Bacteroidales bacterium]
MRFKAFFIYVGVGIAFLAVSLWVILTAGKNSKAVSAKYKLGGMLIATWAMLSACTCNGPGVGTVTCYDPIPPEQPMCYDVAVMVNEVVLESTTIKKGENFRISIKEPTGDNYVARILSSDGKELQKATLAREEGSNWDFFFKASSSLPAGKAVLVVEYIHKENDTEEHVDEIFRSEDITIE